MSKYHFIAIWFSLLSVTPGYSSDVAITLDDPNTYETPRFLPKERDEQIRATLRKFKLKTALFVCGMRVDNPEGQNLLKAWDKDGHWIANHTYSHENLNSSKISYDFFSKDFERCDKIISKLTHFQKFFRFPFLKEGDTQQKRDLMRKKLMQMGYQQGAVTIDASDWYMDERLAARLKQNPKADLKPYRDFYLKHIWDRANYYDQMAKTVVGRQIKHTLLIHHSLLNALFLGDLLKMFQEKGWRLIDAAEAFKDPVFERFPNILPAGESLIWGLAKESGKYEGKLRYPGEDGDYEKEKMDQLGL